MVIEDIIYTQDGQVRIAVAKEVFNRNSYLHTLVKWI